MMASMLCYVLIQVNDGRALMQVLRLPEKPSQASSHTFIFEATALEAAGPHTVFAEWQEIRPGLPLATLKSPACSIAVIAGPPAQVEVSIPSTCGLLLQELVAMRVIMALCSQ
jgi:hypothetical protein